MAWVKVPADNYPLFHAALPKDPRVSTVRLFGSIAGLVNGNMFCGLFGRSALVKLAELDHESAMSLDGSAPFDPMGTGRVMTNTVVLPETIMDEPSELRSWFRKAFDYAVTLPAKKKKAPAKKVAAKKVVAKKAAAAKKPAAKKPLRKARSR